LLDVTSSFVFVLVVSSGGNEDMFPYKAFHILDTFYCSVLLSFISWMCMVWCRNWHKRSTGLHVKTQCTVMY